MTMVNSDLKGVFFSAADILTHEFPDKYSFRHLLQCNVHPGVITQLRREITDLVKFEGSYEAGLLVIRSVIVALL